MDDITMYLGSVSNEHRYAPRAWPSPRGDRPMADLVMVILRAIHLVGTVFWVGGTFLVAGYHEYVIDPGNPKRTLQRMAEYDEMSTMVGVSGIVGVLAGVVMYWIVSDGLTMAWITSTYGVTITVGAVAGLIAIAVAIPFVGLTNNRSVELYEETSGAEELTEEQIAEVGRLRSRLHRGERLAALFMLIAVLAMATAQYV